MKKNTPVMFFVLYFLFCIVTSFVHPVTPAFLKSINAPDYMSGVSMASMSFGAFLMCPLWGKLGDRGGYVKYISIGYIGYAFAQLMFANSTTVPAIIMARTLSGLTSAAAGVNSLSYLSAVTDDERTRSRYFAIFVTMQTVGSAGGYLIGGLMGDRSVSFVFYAQIVSVVVLSVIMLMTVKENRVMAENSKLRLHDVNPIASMMTSLGMIDKKMKVFLVLVFLACIALSANDTYFNYFLMDQLDFPPSGNGLFKAVVGGIAIVANGTINMWIIAKTDIRKSTTAVLALSSVTLVAVVCLSGVPVFLVSSLAYYTLSIILMPLMQSLAMTGAGNVGAGVASGLYNSISSFGRGFGPLLAGAVYGLNPRGPFILAAVFFGLSAIVGVISSRQYAEKVD